MLNIAVVGAGHLGEFHIKLLKSSGLFNLICFYDPDKSRVKYISDKYKINFIEITKISSLVDAVVISTPTSFHYETAVRFLNKKKHVFIEKPITSTIDQANKLIEIKNNNKLIGQVGHVERFNSAFINIKNALNPMFIESHRLSSYPSRGTDVSVVLDLMIHDIDIILSLVDSKITKISANGTKIISTSPDIANARIEFENGCVANLTSSRLSLKKMRKMRVFQRESYISVDFDTGSSEIIKVKNYDGKNKYAMTIHDSEGIEKEIQIDNVKNEKINSIEEEHKNFYHSIINKEDPIVSFEKGRDALELAIKIVKIIEN